MDNQSARCVLSQVMRLKVGLSQMSLFGLACVIPPCPDGPAAQYNVADDFRIVGFGYSAKTDERTTLLPFPLDDLAVQRDHRINSFTVEGIIYIIGIKVAVEIRGKRLYRQIKVKFI